MKTPKYIEDIFQKYVNNTLTKDEFNTFLEFVRNPETKENVKELFQRYWKDMDVSKKNRVENVGYEPEFLFEQILDQIDDEGKKKDSKTNRSAFVFRIAASVIVLLGVSFYFYENDFFQNTKVVSSPVEIDPNSITLTLSDGNMKVISENGEEQILDKAGNVIGTQDGNQISYSAADEQNNKSVEANEKLVYNELIVPYGKLFDIELSDGTLIKLNAGTSIKYPVKFLKGLERKVFLKGEAYFEVAKDKEHPFIVNANDINVEVLGTEFNMSYYPEDEDISTVLVEGSVKLFEETALSKSKSETILKPGHKAAWHKNNKKMAVDKVDTQLYTAWKDGILLFKRSPYDNIIKKLERHYDVTIENHYPLLATQVYTATFRSQEETIEDILEAFKEDTPFKYIKVNKDKKIIITEP